RMRTVPGTGPRVSRIERGTTSRPWRSIDNSSARATRATLSPHQSVDPATDAVIGSFRWREHLGDAAANVSEKRRIARVGMGGAGAVDMAAIKRRLSGFVDPLVGAAAVTDTRPSAVLRGSTDSLFSVEDVRRRTGQNVGGRGRRQVAEGVAGLGGTGAG